MSPLEDEDRWPWFDRIIEAVQKEHGNGQDRVLVGCSALKKSYRDYLFQSFSDDWKVIFLEGSFDTIFGRMKKRKHFMPPELLESQFATLERPEYDLEKLLVLSIEKPVDELAATASRWLS